MHRGIWVKRVQKTWPVFHDDQRWTQLYSQRRFYKACDWVMKWYHLHSLYINDLYWSVVTHHNSQLLSSLSFIDKCLIQIIWQWVWFWTPINITKLYHYRCILIKNITISNLSSHWYPLKGVIDVRHLTGIWYFTLYTPFIDLSRLIG